MKKIFIFSVFLLIFLCTSCQADIKVAQVETELYGSTVSAKSATSAADDTNDEDISAAAEITEISGTAEHTSDEIFETEVTDAQETITEAAETTETEAEQIAVRAKNIPVFMYHTSSENQPGGLAELYVKPSEFEKQIQYLIENNYTFCTFDDWYNLHSIDKPVFLTFDDGYQENYTEIFPVLQKYDAKITIFLMINNIAAENFTVEMIREMSDSGLVKFESHTVSHLDLISLDDAKLTSELADSKRQIEEITGKPVLALAYPAGSFNDSVKEKAREYYLFGVRRDLGMHNTDYNDFEIRRFRMNRSTSLDTFIDMLG